MGNHPRPRATRCGINWWFDRYSARWTTGQNSQTTRHTKSSGWR